MINCPMSYDDIPLVLTIEDLMSTLRIGRSSAFNLIHSGRLGSLLINNRMLVLKHELIAFLEGETGTDTTWTNGSEQSTLESDSCRAAKGGNHHAAR